MRPSSRLVVAGASLIAIGSFVACGGSSATTPTPRRTATPLPTSTVTTSPSTPTPSPKPTATVTPSPKPTITPTPTPTQVACVDQNLPGTYTTMFVLGNYAPSSGAFTGISGSVYAVVPYSPATATPSPVPTPTATPIGIPIYSWSGIYTVNGSQGPIVNGCVAMVVTQNGQPFFPSSPNSGFSLEFPQFAGGYTFPKSNPGGAVTIFSVATSSTGGIGTFQLDNGSSGTVVLGPRLPGILDSARLRGHSTPFDSRLPF